MNEFQPLMVRSDSQEEYQENKKIAKDRKVIPDPIDDRKFQE